MRVILFAPTKSSLYSRLVAHELGKISGVELKAIVIRRLWSTSRIRVDLRREGPRLLKKIYHKLVLREERMQGAALSPLALYANQVDLGITDLEAYGRDIGIPCKRVSDFNSESCRSALTRLAPDLIVFTGGGLIRKEILAIPEIGILNCHSGLLPNFRGMDTLEWAILEAGQESPTVGLTLHLMDSGVDTGPILRQHREPLHAGDTLDEIRSRLEPEMVRLVTSGVHDLLGGILKAVPQKASAGRQYFVIHPRLQALAQKRLSVGW